MRNDNQILKKSQFKKNKSNRITDNNTYRYIKICFFLSIVFYSFTASSQNVHIEKITLDWSNKETFHLEKGKSWQMPIVKNQSINTELRLPTFNKKWKAPQHSKISWYKLKNISYKTISKNSLFDVSLNNIPEKIQSNLQIVSTKDNFDIYFNLTPLIKENNQIKQIISFELHYQLTTDNISKSVKTYASNSVLASGDFYKFSIDKTGVFKLDYNFLKKIGVDVKNINPKHLSIYGNGGGILPYRIGDFRYDDLQENAITVKGESDGKFDSGDYILFYARGPESWKHNNSVGSLAHKNNIYSNQAYYFVHIKNQAAKRIELATEINASFSTDLSNYDDYIVHELEKRNLFQMGQSWVGEAFDVDNEQTISLNFPNIDTAAPLIIRTKVVASSDRITYMNVAANGTDIYEVKVLKPTSYNLAREGVNEIDDLFLNSENIELKLTYNNSGNPSSEAFLDYIEIIGKKKLIANGKQFSFRNFETLGAGIYKYTIQNNSKTEEIWNVTDPINPKKITNQGNGDSFSFNVQGNELSEFVLLNQQDYYTPKSLSSGRIANQNLHGLINVDYVIITQDFLVDEAKLLAQHHIDKSDLNTIVVPLHQIYNEFGSGSPDITAIRDFIKFLYDTSTPKLQYVLLYGDTSYDPKGIFEKGENIVPSYHAFNSYSETLTFVTDDYFAIVSHNNEGDLNSSTQVQTQDVAIGRIPVRTQKEAHDVTRKLLNYYKTSTFGDWRNQIVMATDDSDKSSDIYLQTSQEKLSDNIKENKRVFNIKKIYADAYPQIISSGGASYPAVTKEITQSIEKGSLVFNYFGHGGEDGLAAERILTTNTISSWSNFDKLPLIVIISCEFARIDNPSRPNTAGELIIRNTKGAGVSHIATARSIFISTGQRLNDTLMPYLLEYNGVTKSIAENLRLTKNKNNAASKKQRYFVFSLGDPAMKLAVPRPNIRITHMNEKPITQPLDTIKALSHIRFRGVVTKEDGSIENDFNGTLYTTIFDKEIDKQTLDNDGIAGVMVFDTQESKLFRGSATVTNGKFNFDFITPKDMRIAYGKGKLSFYAHNNKIDKAGYNIDVTIGGINEDAPEDNLSPTIQLYMNDKSFIDGGTTSQSPNLLAYFQDENGINTALSSVGHDIVAILDNDQLNPIVLNDYYATEPNNYKKGSLEYRLRNLDIGIHTLHLKAYDTYNNLGEATLNFRVLDDRELVLEHVLNYPNPFINHTEFWFNHNKPNEPLEVQVQIYTVSGKLIKTINQLIQTAGSLSKEITWDGLDDFGAKIGKGVYVYKLSVKATLSGLKAEKFEKLVLLQ